jgi:hypothetical protein
MHVAWRPRSFEESELESRLAARSTAVRARPAHPRSRAASGAGSGPSGQAGASTATGRHQLPRGGQLIRRQHGECIAEVDVKLLRRAVGRGPQLRRGCHGCPRRVAWRRAPCSHQGVHAAAHRLPPIRASACDRREAGDLLVAQLQLSRVREKERRHVGSSADPGAHRRTGHGTAGHRARSSPGWWARRSVGSLGLQRRRERHDAGEGEHVRESGHGSLREGRWSAIVTAAS